MSVRPRLGNSEKHTRAGRRGQAASRLPPQGRARRRALVSVHAPSSAPRGSDPSLLAWKTRQSGLSPAGEGASSPPASVCGTRESGARPRLLPGVTGSRPATRHGRGRPAHLGPDGAAQQPPLHSPRSHSESRARSPSCTGGARVPALRPGLGVPGPLLPRAGLQWLPPARLRPPEAPPAARAAQPPPGRPRARASALGAPPGRRARGAGRAAAAVGAERGALRPGARRPQSPGRALLPPLTRAAGSSPFEAPPAPRRRGEGQRQQIGELAGPRSGLRRELPRPGRCAALESRPCEREPPAAAPKSPGAGPRRPPPAPAAPGAPPWGPGSASGCCCPPPSCSTRRAAGPPRR